MNIKSIALSTLVAVSVCFSASCAKKNPNGAGSEFDFDENGRPIGSGGAGDFADFRSGDLPNRDERFSYFNASTGQFEPVYFAFDSFSISSQEMRKIDAVADYVRKKGADILVAGFTDAVKTERGVS